MSTVFALGFLVAMESANSEPALALESDSSIPQGGIGTISIVLSGGTEAYGGIEAHLSFPTGISMISASKGTLLTDDYVIESRSFLDGDVRKGSIIAYSESGGVEMDEGVLVRVRVQATSDARLGDRTVRFDSGAVGVTLEACAESVGFSSSNGIITVVEADTGGGFCAASMLPEETRRGPASMLGDLMSLLLACVLLIASRKPPQSLRARI